MGIGDEVRLVKDREGIIKFKGQIEGKKGSYYGVEVTVGKGKHDGEYKNLHYFDCREGQGIFVEDKHIVFKLNNTIKNVLDKKKKTKQKKKKKKRPKTPLTPNPTSKF